MYVLAHRSLQLVRITSSILELEYDVELAQLYQSTLRYVTITFDIYTSTFYQVR